MQELVCLIRTESELIEALKKIEALKARAKKVGVGGGRTYNPGWHTALDLKSLLTVAECCAKAALDRKESRGGHTRDDHPYTDDTWGTINVVAQPGGRRRRRAAPRAAAEDARRAQGALPGEKVDADLHHAGVPRRPGRRRVQGLPRRVRGGHGRPRRDPPPAGDAGARPRVPLELQGRQVRLVQRGGQRQAAAHVHDAHEPVRRRARRSAWRRIRTFPIIRDLVTDVSYNYEKAKQIPPLRLKPPDPDGKYRMMQEDVDRAQEFHKCIECFLCQDVCHVIRDHEELQAEVLGPALLHQDRRPRHASARHASTARTFVAQHAGIGLCNITKCCTEVCPEHIHITDNGIIPMKERDGRTATTRSCGSCASSGAARRRRPRDRLRRESSRVPGQGAAARVRRRGAERRRRRHARAGEGDRRAARAARSSSRRRSTRAGAARAAASSSPTIRPGAEAAAKQILGMMLKTPQTPPEGIKVRKVLVEEASAIDRELYLSITLDRARGTHVVHGLAGGRHGHRGGRRGARRRRSSASGRTRRIGLGGLPGARGSRSGSGSRATSSSRASR